MTLPDRPTPRILPAPEADAWHDGFAFLAAARAEAQAIRDTATAEIAAARDQGRAEGREQGEAEAARLLLTTKADIDRYLDTMRPRIAALVGQILNDVLGDMDDADLIARATRHALTTFRETESVTLSVPADKLAQVESLLQGTPLRVTADRHLTGRQCILTSPVSSIDIGIDAQIQAIRAAMDAA